MSSRLFGRLQESAALADAFARVSSTSGSEIVLLSGAAGIGKSALVNRFQSLIRVGRHRFVHGKSEHNNNGAAFASVTQALRGLFDAALGQSDEALAELQERLQESAGGLGRLITDLVPEAKVLFGVLPLLPELPVGLAQARLHRALIGTLGAFAERQQPLVLFLDDLQWADPSTTALLSAFASAPPANTLLVGSYREEGADRLETPDGLVTQLREAPIPLTEISLAPLDTRATEEMIAHALDVAPAAIAPLASTIQKQALGNPFYTEHFLRRLLEEGILRHDLTSGEWHWDDQPLQSVVGSGDVLDFIAGRVARLGGAQKAVLASLAALGGHADPEILAALLGMEQLEIERLAEELMSVGLLKGEDAGYGFPHDRILEAADLLTPLSEQPPLHARIARLLIAKRRVVAPEQVFQLAGHILRAVTPTSPAPLRTITKLLFARALLAAAEQARLAAASEQTAIYLDAAAILFQDSWWSTHHEVAVGIIHLWADSLLLRGDVVAAEAAINSLLARRLNDRDRASACRLLAALRTVQSDYEGATAAALEGLTLLGHALTRAPSAEECMAASDRIRELMGDRPVAPLVDMPLAEDPEVALATSLLSTLIVCVFTGDDLRFLHLAKIVELTVTCGVTADSAYGMAWYGVMISDFYGRFEDGFAYGQAALELVDRHGFEGQRTGALVAVDQLSPWTRSFEYALAQVHNAIEGGHAAGDLAMTCFARNHLVSDLLQMGRPLIQVEEEADKGLELTRRISFRDIELLIASQQALARWLRTGEAAEPYEANGEITSVSTQFWVRLYDGIGAYMFGDFERAGRSFSQAAPLCWALPAHIDLVYHALFAALNAAKHLPRDEALAAMEPHRARLEQWLPLNPPMFEHKLLLVMAEMERLRGTDLKALRFYDAAIQAAGSFVHERGLARELAGYHCRALGLEGLAKRYFQDAIVDYRLWGAEAKARQVPSLVDETDEGAAARELLSAMKTIQEITRESDLERLRIEVLRALMRHTDADRGKLLLIHDGDPVIEAEGLRVGEEIETFVGTFMPTPDRIASDILASIMRASVPIHQDVLTGPEDSLAANGLRSIVGLPLMMGDQLVGVAYLEANPERSDLGLRKIPILEKLSAQAAICLERAQWHATTYENYERRAQAEDALRAARAEMVHTSHLATMGGLAASIAHEINQPLSSIVSYASAGARWLRRAQPNVDEALQNLSAIRAAGLRASEIVAALRSLAKQDSIQRERLDLLTVIAGVLEVTQSEIEARKVDLVTEFAASEPMVSGDRVQLQQLILNLVNNAMDAMVETPVEDRFLKVACSEQDGIVVVRVEDKGCGIPDDAMEKIFMPLFSTKSKGMGMGLAICKSVVEAHGGRLEVGRVPQGGTFFQIMLSSAR
jgi:predicted ATPase/signal transduction histidine kinase